jgi:4-carboxymuconolactone decarboxylase
MARLPYVDPEQAAPEVREALEALPPLNIFRTLAHAETSLRPALRLGQSILMAQQLDARLRELAILRVARLTGAEYEWVQHVAIGRAVGVTEEQVAALERDDAEAACFDDRERLALRVTTEVVEDDGTSEATLAAARDVFSSREVVELIVAAGYYQLLAALMNSVDIDLDEPVGTAVIDSAPSPPSAPPTA